MQDARYEYRVFAPDLGLLETRLRGLAPLSRYRESLETYLLIPGRHDLNLKIRDGNLELKRLLRRERELEQWHPEFRQPFPVPVTRLMERLEGCLTLEEPPTDDGDWEAERFVQWVTDPYFGVAVASLFKQRFSFELADCFAEIAALRINGARLMSLALESVDPEVVLTLRDHLGLAQEQNIGYVLALERVLGRAPLPQGAYYNAGLP